jgi:hypothetical protein
MWHRPESRRKWPLGGQETYRGRRILMVEMGRPYLTEGQGKPKECTLGAIAGIVSIVLIGLSLWWVTGP